MTPGRQAQTVFVAHAVTNAFSDHSASVVAELRPALTNLGWTVLPQSDRSEGTVDGELNPNDLLRLVDLNVRHVVGSALLVLVVSETGDPLSSLWVEAGMALASEVPGIVVAARSTPIPFLVEAAIRSPADHALGWRRLVADVTCEDPGQRRHTARRVAAEIASEVEAYPLGASRLLARTAQSADGASDRT